MSLQLIGITRRYGAQLALDGVSLHVRRGDCYGFLGHNGAGKTTAMRIALGLQRPSAGTVLVDGFDARAHPREARARMGGLIEVPGFHGSLDGARNLELLARLGGLGRAESRRESRRLLELVGLAHAGPKQVQDYSHGMRQRLGIAQALIGSPAYVLLDEPTNGLDPEGIAEVRDLLRSLVERGTTVLLSSHQLHEISDLCTRIGVLYRGRLMVEEESAKLLAPRGRYELVSHGDGRAAAVLAELDIPTVQVRGGLELELGGRAPAEVARVLVQREVELTSFAPRRTTLEEIYLRHSRGEAAALPPAAPAIPPLAAPEHRLAPPRPSLAVARYEAVRWLLRPRFLGLVLLPAAAGAIAVQRRLLEVRSSLEQVERGAQFSTTDVTAFEGVAVALGTGLPLLALLLAGVASQSIAGELARGTLRNLLLRPVRRFHAASGKALAQVGLALLAYAVLAAVSLAAAAAAFDFRDLVEVLPNGATFPLRSAEELWPLLRHALWAPVLPLVAYAGIGFLAGALVRGAAGALGLALGLPILLDLARSLARGPGLEGWLPSAYLPSPLGDSSYLELYADASQGISNTVYLHGGTEVGVPLLWALCTFGLAALVLSRRRIS